MILDYYFRRPLFWDYLIAIIFTSFCIKLNHSEIIFLPNKLDSINLTTDLTNISLTLSGFILTILTILITFKSSSNLKTTDINEDSSVFDLFFASNFYFETIKHLKNCIKSVLIIAIIGFGIKLFLVDKYKEYSFFFNIFGLIVTLLTIWRCLLILSKVLVLQKENNKHNPNL